MVGRGSGGQKRIALDSKKGKVFYGCNHYPDCKTAYWYEPTGNKCPKCGGMLVKKQDSIVCNECSYQIETQE